MRWSLISILLLLPVIGIVTANEESLSDGTIYGHVYDAQTKQPVSGAWVYCQETKCPKQLTDSNGYYAIENCFSPSSTYVIDCTKSGYATTKNNAQTDSSGEAKVDFNLGNTPNPSPNPSSIEVTSWEKTFGGSGNDRGWDIQQTKDGGYILVGASDVSNEGSVSKLWLIKINPQGNMEWNRKFGEENHDNLGTSVRQTTDGGYIIVGSTDSSGTGESHVWLIKTDADGNKLWERTFGGSEGSDGVSVRQTRDNGYIIIGDTFSLAGVSDIFLIKTDASGKELWDRIFGGSQMDLGLSLQQTVDEGYIIAGMTRSYGAGNQDIWLIKTDSNGNKQWDRTFGGPNEDIGYKVKVTIDGGYIIAGYTGTSKGHSWLIKTDSNGNEQWDKTYRDFAPYWSVQQTIDEGYILAGTDKGDTSLIKTDVNGNTIWERTFKDVSCSSVECTSEGGYIILGTKNEDIWLKKTDSNGN